MYRDFDFAKQQQVAMKLHRMGGPEADSCLWWAVVSLVLQARSAPAGEHPGTRDHAFMVCLTVLMFLGL